MHFIQPLLHLDRFLVDLMKDYGTTVYLILFLVLFAETGLVVTPFLPGDSLLFAAGTLVTIPGSPLNLPVLMLVLFAGALTGDNVNYMVGKFLGPKLFNNENSKILNRKHLEKTHKFFEGYGGKTIIIARFVPIVRTFTPFVAGVGAMTYMRFLMFSIAGAALWVAVCVSLGYFFGQIPSVKHNFTLVVLAIIAISLVPAVIEIMKHRREAKTDNEMTTD